MFLLIALFVALVWIRLYQELPQRSIRKSAVFITGCDTGIGNLIASRLTKNGVTVYAGCLTQEGVSRLQSDEEIPSSCSLHPFQLDVTKSDSIDKAFEYISKHLSETDCTSFSLINNAGIHRGFFVEMTGMEDYRSTMEVNFFGLVEVTKKFLPLVRKYKNGSRIINITSLAGRISNFGMSTYSASKYAAEAFTDSLRLELYPFNIPVILIEPGFSLTPLVQSVSGLVGNTLQKCPEEILNVYGGKQDVEKKTERYCKRIVKSAFPVQKIVDTLVDVYGAEYPKPRYVIGSISKIIAFLTALPSEIMDKLMISTWK